MVCGKLCVGDAVLDWAEKNSSTAVARAISASSGVVSEARVGRGRGQLTFPQAGRRPVYCLSCRKLASFVLQLTTP